MDILIKSAHIIDPKNKIDDVCDILIEKNVITNIGKNISTSSVKEIDAQGRINLSRKKAKASPE